MTAAQKRNTLRTNLTTKGDMYHVIISYYDISGKRKQKWISTGLSVKGNNKRKAEQRMKEIEKEWSEKIHLSNNDMLFSDYLREWLNIIKHSVSENTYWSYKNQIENVVCPFFDQTKVTLCDLTTEDIQAFYDFKLEHDGRSANTIHHYHANIRKALNYAVDMERIHRNPALKAVLPKVQKHIPNFYTREQAQQLLKKIKGNKIEPVVVLAACFGMRRGEILGLRWSSIDFNRMKFTINGTIKDKGASGSRYKNSRFETTAKTSASFRSFSLSEHQAAYLKALKKQQDRLKKNPGYNHDWDDFVCVLENGDLIQPDYVSRRFPVLCERLGLPRLKLHELRHTNISLLVEEGIMMKEISAWAGHSNMATTANIYAHLQANANAKLSAATDNIFAEQLDM